MKKKTIIIFEPESQGHQADYLKLLVESFDNESFRIILLIDRDVLKRMRTRVDLVSAKNIDIVFLSELELKRCRSRVLLVRSVMQWTICRHYAEKHKAHHVLFLFLDAVQLSLAFFLRWPSSIKVSGLLFRPTIHYKTYGMVPGEKYGETLKRWSKKLVLRMAMRNPALNVVFTMDEYFFEYSSTNPSNESRVVYLPDPAVMHEDCLGLSEKTLNNIPKERKVFLLFGALSERKGIFKVLSAIEKLPMETINRVFFIFAGRISERDRERFYKKVEKLKERRDVANCLDVKDYFLNKNEIARLFLSCDIVFAPYQRFVGPSGIILWAACAGREVITQDYGLIGRWVKKFDLGVTIDTTSVDSLIEVINNSAKKEKDGYVSSKASEFIHQHDSELFKKIFYSNL